MKKLILTILFCLIASAGYTQEAILEVDTLYKQESYLGEELDKVVIGDEKVVRIDATDSKDVKTYIEPTIKFTKWNEEESPTLSYPTPTGMTDKTLIDGEGVRLYGGAEDFYFKQYDDQTMKFGLILNEIPDKSKIVTIDGVEYYQWVFKLTGWENFDFLKQEIFKDDPKCVEVNINGKTYYRIYHTDDDGYKQHEDKVDGSCVVYHKTKKNYEIGKTNYGMGRIGCIFRPQILDADGKFLGWANLDIKDGQYILSAETKLFDAKYPIKFNDEFGYHPLSGGTADARSNRTGVALCSLSANGTVTTISACLDDANWSGAAIYNITSGDPSTIKTSPAYLAGTSQTKLWKTYNVTDTALTSGDWGLCLWLADSNTFYYYDTDASYHIDWESGEFLDPFVLQFTDSSRRMWIYATYTPSAGGARRIIFID